VAVGVSGQSSFARFIKLPPVEDRKIPEIVRFEAIQQIPFPLDDVEWSYQLFRDPESPEVEVGIFAMRKELVNHHISFYTDLGMNVQCVQMVPLAVYNAMYHDERIDGTTMFMDSGAENTDLVIADGETAWLRTLPIGGNNFTEALAKTFKLDFAKAEDLKRNAATSKYAKQIFQAMRPVFADLVAEVQRSIGFYASVHRDARIKRIVALGGTFRLPGLQKYLQQHLQLDVTRIDAFRATPAEGRAATSFTENVVSLAGAYGLALQGLERSKIVSSLLPESIRRAKMWKEKTRWFAAAAALFLVGTLGIATRYLMDSMAYDSAKSAEFRNEADTLFRQAQGLSNQWRGIEGRGERDRDRIIRIQALEKYRDLWPRILGDITGALPPNDPRELADATAQGDAAVKAYLARRATWLQQEMTAARPARKLIFLDAIGCRYRPDISDIIDVNKVSDAVFSDLVEKDAPPGSVAPGGGGGPIDSGGYINPDEEEFSNRSGRPMPGMPGRPGGWSDGRRGYLISIRGYTPHASGGALVSGTLLKWLGEMTESRAVETRRPYYVARVKIARLGKRNISPAAAGPRFIGEGDPDAGFAPGALPAGAIDPAIDRTTGESLANDTEFTLIVAVVLDPRPAPKTNDQDR
jgi:type IV pilus assembly protein PilM